MSVSLPLCPVNHITSWRSFMLPVIAHIACGPRVPGQIPWMAVWYSYSSVPLFVGLLRFCICIIFRCGGPALRYPPNWGPKESSGVQLSLYVFLSVSLLFLLCHSFAIMHMARNCMRHVKPEYDLSSTLGPAGPQWGPVEIIPQWNTVNLILQTGFQRTLVGYG